MAESNGQLTAIKDLRELYQLRDLYRSDWPRHCVGFYCLSNFIAWLERQPHLKNLEIFTLNDDWKSQGLVLIVDRYQLFLHCLVPAKQTESLSQALDLLDWRGGYKVSSFQEQHRDAVVKVVASRHLNLEYDSLTLMYYMPQAEAIKLEYNCPQGFTLQPLSINDAETIDDLWPNKHQGSLFLIRRLIEWNINMGVYEQETNELVAWCLRLQGGFLGALQVKNSHKRRGLGSLVTRAITHRIAEMGDDVMALVNPDNFASCGMFDQVGFKVTDRCYWLRTFPTKPGYSWPDNQ